MSCACETQDRELRRLRDRLHASTKANTEHRARIRELEGYNAWRTECEDDNRRLRDRIKELEEMLVEHDRYKDCGELHDRYKDCVALHDRIRELEGQLWATETRNKELRAKTADLREDEAKKLRERVKDLEGKLHASTKAHTEQRARTREVEARNKDLHAQVKELKENELEREPTFKMKNERIRDLKARVKELEGFVCTACKDTAAENAHLMKINREVAKENTRLRDEPKASEIGHLMNRNTELVKVAAWRAIEVKALETRVKELEGSCVDCTITKKYASLSVENKELRTRIKELEADVHKPHWLRDVEAKLRARVKELEKRNGVHLDERDLAWKRIKVLEEERDNRDMLEEGGRGALTQERYNALGNAVVEILAHPAVGPVGLHNALHDARKLLALEAWETPPLGEPIEGRDKTPLKIEGEEEVGGIMNDAQDGPYTNPRRRGRVTSDVPYKQYTDDTNTWRKG